METSYKPHPHSQSITLPGPPPGVSLASIGGGSGIQQWFRGLSSNPVPHYTGEALEFSQKRWERKWSYYKQTQKDPNTFPTMGKSELLSQVKHLEAELARLKTRFTEMNLSKASAEMSWGVQFILSLIENQNTALIRLQGGNVTEPPEILKDEVKLIDQVYQFALQSLDYISRLHMQQILEMRTQTMDQDFESTRSISLHSEPEEQKSASGLDSEAPTPAPIPGPSRAVSSDSGTAQAGVVLETKGILQQGDNRSTYPPNPRGTATEHQRSPPALPPPPTQALSTAASHHATLLSLSAISFLGAGMAWAIVFSSTRGDIVVFSWAASCFLIASASAACGTSLLAADGTLVERFLTVRWTIRLLSLCATVHVFIGIMLVSAAILILDPNAEKPQVGIGGDKFNIIAGRAAGAYSFVVCGVVAPLTFIVRRRYSRRTWFMV